MSGKGDEDGRSGFLSRWSRMKRDAVRPEGEVPEPPVSAPIDQPPGETADVDAITEEEIAALPPVESVTDRAGLEPFFRKGVPAALRNAARRRMWMMNPKIADYLDVARDYAYDWNTPGGVPGFGGPLAPGMAAQLVEKMISRGDWRNVAEAESPVEAEKPAAPQEAGEEAEDLDTSSESPTEQQDEGADGTYTAPASTKTLVQGNQQNVERPEAAENPSLPARRHGGATPRCG